MWGWDSEPPGERWAEVRSNEHAAHLAHINVEPRLSLNGFPGSSINK